MAQTDQPLPVLSSDELGLAPEREGFDKYAFMLDFDITRSTCGGRAGRYASEMTQRAYMVWADQQCEIARLRNVLNFIAVHNNTGWPARCQSSVFLARKVLEA